MFTLIPVELIITAKINHIILTPGEEVTIENFLENSSLKRKQQFYALKDSLQKNGFNDLFPMEIVLCCIWGVQDTLYQGHYRMALCLNMGIKRVSVRFLSAPHAPRWMSFFLIKWRQSIKKKK